MANSYFKFKQFTINQDKCAMKVCTDACLFGAVAASKELKNTRCLDIGTGTGLLSLMIAQKNDIALIDAVELNADAAGQALDNFTASSWKDKIQLHCEDILAFNPGVQYDYIISNPPFFEGDLKSPDEEKNLAKHNTTLDLSQLLAMADRHLFPGGTFALLLPYQRVNYFVREASKTGLHLMEQILVKQSIKHEYFRGILFFSRKESMVKKSEVLIRDSDNNYTTGFTGFLKEYYLAL